MNNISTEPFYPPADTILDEATEGVIEALPVDEPSLLALGDRLLRELADTRAERTANRQARTVEVERLLNAYAELDLPLERREARLLTTLEQVAKCLPKRGKAKSRQMAFGRIGWQWQDERLVLEDEEATLQWIRLQETEIAAALIRKPDPKIAVAKVALDAYCLPRNIVPPGCTKQEARDTFYAKPSEPHA